MRIKMKRTLQSVMFAFMLVSTSFVAASPPSSPSFQDDGPALLAQLGQLTGGKARISRHHETGLVRFVGTTPDHPIGRAAGLPDTAAPEAAARSFLQEYGQLFGLKNQAQELQLLHEKPAPSGRAVTRLQQVHGGIPVLAGELNVQTDAKGNVLSANGEIAPGLAVDVAPRINPTAASQEAIAIVAKHFGVDPATLTTTRPERWIYHPALLGGPGVRIPRLVWRMDVTSTTTLDIRELVLIDAQRGGVALNFSRIAHGRNRETYDANNGTTLPGTLRCNEANPNCTGGDAHEVAAHTYTGQVYDFFITQFNRDSIDNKGMTLKSTVHYDSGYFNAFWNGTQMVYGDYALFPMADDVVGHELAHGVTEKESGLFYYYQSGAINESMSDVFGELFDLTNSALTLHGTDTAATRWLIGEDMKADATGALRNMTDPPNPPTGWDVDPNVGQMTPSPDRINSALFHTDTSDSGGVHINSGVNNKAAALMVDGGSFNGKTVAAIGATRALAIYYEVNTNLLVSGSDYLDLYDALLQACTTLVGTKEITAATCTSVKNAAQAVEMNVQRASTTDAPICTTAGQAPRDVYYENLEDPNAVSAGWTTQALQGATGWYYDFDYSTSGQRLFYGEDRSSTADQAIAQKVSVAVPSGAFMVFNHAYAFERDSSSFYDGGVVEYSINNGVSWLDASALFTHNGYNATVSSIFGNPIGGREAFSGESQGYYSSRLDLGSLAGQQVRFRFRIGSDSDVGAFGWAVDDLRIYRCLAAPVATNRNVLVNGGFETDKVTPIGKADSWTTPVQASRDTTVKRTGAASLMVASTTDVNVSVDSTVPIAVVAGKAYSVLGWVNIPATSDTFNLSLRVGWQDASNAVVGTTIVKSYTAATTRWDQAARLVTAPAGATKAVVRVVGSSLKMQVNVDDVIFTSNLLANASFEDDHNNDSAPDAWGSVIQQALRSKSSKHSGLYSMRLYDVGDTAFSLAQVVPNIGPGTRLTLSGWANVPTPSPADTFNVSIQLVFRNASGAVIGTTTVKTYTQAATTGGAWQTFTTAAPVTAPANTVTAAVTVVGNSLKAQVFLDDLLLRPVP